MEKELCELCEKRKGAYSPVRKMVVCENCHAAIGRQQIILDALLAVDLSCQDAESD